MATLRIPRRSSPQPSLPAGAWTMLNQLQKTSVVGPNTVRTAALALSRIVISDRAILLRLTLTLSLAFAEPEKQHCQLPNTCAKPTRHVHTITLAAKPINLRLSGVPCVFSMHEQHLGLLLCLIITLTLTLTLICEHSSHNPTTWPTLSPVEPLSNHPQQSC